MEAVGTASQVANARAIAAWKSEAETPAAARSEADHRTSVRCHLMTRDSPLMEVVKCRYAWTSCERTATARHASSAVGSVFRSVFLIGHAPTLRAPRERTPRSGVRHGRDR